MYEGDGLRTTVVWESSQRRDRDHYTRDEHTVLFRVGSKDSIHVTRYKLVTKRVSLTRGVSSIQNDTYALDADHWDDHVSSGHP